jgi:hypothetical protein
MSLVSLKSFFTDKHFIIDSLDEFLLKASHFFWGDPPYLEESKWDVLCVLVSKHEGAEAESTVKRNLPMGSRGVETYSARTELVQVDEHDDQLSRRGNDTLDKIKQISVDSYWRSLWSLKRGWLTGLNLLFESALYYFFSQ